MVFYPRVRRNISPGVDFWGSIIVWALAVPLSFLLLPCSAPVPIFLGFCLQSGSSCPLIVSGIYLWISKFPSFLFRWKTRFPKPAISPLFTTSFAFCFCFTFSLHDICIPCGCSTPTDVTAIQERLLRDIGTEVRKDLAIGPGQMRLSVRIFLDNSKCALLNIAGLKPRTASSHFRVPGFRVGHC